MPLNFWEQDCPWFSESVESVGFLGQQADCDCSWLFSVGAKGLDVNQCDALRNLCYGSD